MRIILLVVFYIAAYAARIAATIPGNSVKCIYRQKTRATRSRVSKVPVDDGMTHKTIKRGKQSSLVNRIDGFLQTRRVPGGKSTRLRRSPRRRTKRARNSDDEVARRRDDFENDDDTDADDVWSYVAGSRGLPVWQVPKSSISTISPAPTTSPTVVRMDNPQNSDADRSSRADEAILPLPPPNSPRMLYESPETPMLGWKIDESQNRREPETRKPVYVLSYPDRYGYTIDKSLASPKSPELSDGETRGDTARNPVSGKPIERVLVPVYRLGTLADASSPRLLGGRPWENPRSHSNIEEESQINDNRPRAGSFRRFLLVPVSKDLYMLKDADADSRPRGSADGDNATSAVLAFKAHLHHDAKDVGRAYLRDRPWEDQRRLPGLEANRPDNPAVAQKEGAGETATRDSTPLSYPNFLYPGIPYPTYPGLIDTLSEMPDERDALGAADYRPTSSADSGIDLDAENDSYGQSEFPSTSSFFDAADYDASSYPGNASDDRRSNISPAIESDATDQFGSDGGHDEETSKYDELDVESTTVALPKFFSTLDINDIDKLITVGESGLHVTDDDGALFSERTTAAYPFDNVEEHATSVWLFPDAEEQSSKRGRTEVENLRALLTAIEPLSSELQRLLSAVKSVNKSISYVQSRLCDKKNAVGSTRWKRGEEEVTKTIGDTNYRDFVSPARDLDRRSWEKKGVASDKRVDDTKLRKRFNGYSSLLSKLAAPSRKRASSFSDFPEGSKKRGSPEFNLDSPRLSRNLKSLTRGHEARAEPTRRFVGLKRVTRATTLPIESDFLDAPSFPGGKSIVPSLSNRDNPGYLVANNKRDPERYNSTSREMEPYTPVDPEHYTEATAYLDVLRLLNMTEEPRTEYPTDFITSTVTRPLPLSTPATTQSVDAATLPPGLAEEATTVPGVTRPEELPEGMDYTTEFEYYEGIDYDDWNHTGMYDNVTSWYEYTEETTSETVNETIIGDTVVLEETTTRAVEITEIAIAATTETTVWYTTVGYPFTTGALITTMAATPTVSPETLETTPTTQSPVTLRALTEQPLFYTTELTAIDEVATPTIEIVTDETVALLTTEMFATEAATATPTTTKFTIEPTIILTPLLEGMTDITLKVTIPALTETTLPSVVETTEEEMTDSTVAGLPTVLETEETTTLTTLADTTVATTTEYYLTPEEEESPVTQIEKTITAEEVTTTESPTTTEAPTTIEIPTTIETSTTSETPTTTIARTTQIPIPTVVKATTATKIPTTTRTPTTIRVPTAAEVPTTTENRTTTKIPTTMKTTTTIRTPTATKIPTTAKIPTTSKFPTTVRTTKITTAITTKITTTELPTTIRTPTATEVLTTTETPTTLETLITTETITTVKLPTTTTATLKTTETPTITESLAVTVTPTTVETATTKIPTITETPSTAETPTTIELRTTTKILTTSETPIITNITTMITPTTIIETPTATEILTTTEILETSPTVETPTTIEVLTTTETPTTFETPITTETITTVKLPTTTTATLKTTETPTITESLAVTVTPTTAETATTKIPTITETPSTAETPTIIDLRTTTKILTTSETPIVTNITTIITPTTTIETPTATEILTTTEVLEISPTIETPTTIEVLTVTETLTTFEIPITTEDTTVTKMPTSTIEFPTTTESPTTAETLTATETSTTVEPQTTIETPSVTEITTAKIPTTTETVPTTEILTTITISTTAETLTTTETSTITETRPTTIFTTTFSTFLTETTESTTSPMIIIATKTSPTEELETITISPIFTTVSTETFPITSSIATDIIVNATVPSTTASTITTEILESTISPLINFTAPLTTEIPVTTAIAPDTGTTAEEYYPETSTEEKATATTSTTETEEESTATSVIIKEIIVEVTAPMTYLPSPTTFVTETTTEATSLVNETTILPFTPTITAATPIVTTSSTITEETSTTEEVTSTNFTTISEETPSVKETIGITFTTKETLTSTEVTSVTTERTTVSEAKTTGITFTTEETTSTEVTWVTTERTTVSEAATITTTTSFVPTVVNVTEIVTTFTASPEITTETRETSTTTTTVTLSPTTERPKDEEILEITATKMPTPLTESTLVTTETSATTPEVTSVLPKTVSETEEFTIVPSTTVSPTTSFVKTTVYPVTSTSAATTEVMPEVETEYYVDKALLPQYEDEEEEEEYDTEIPTDKWYYYDETTTKERTVVTPSTVSYTKLPEEKVTSPPLVEAKPTPTYEPEFTTSPIVFETLSATYIGVTSTITTETTESTESTTSPITFETVSTTYIGVTSTITTETTESTESTESTEFTTSSASEETVTTATTFGSTEEYTLPPSTVLEITTKPLESLTISAKYIYTEPDQLKPIAKPKKIVDQEVELKTTKIATTSERVSTSETEVEKSTFFFVTSVLTTLSEEELMDAYATTVSSVVPDVEMNITSYEVTTETPKTISVAEETEESTIWDKETTTITTYTDTARFTTEEILPRFDTPFTVPEVVAEFTTMSKIGEEVVREQHKKRLQKQLDELARHEKEMAEREERLKEQERQWDQEKKRRKEKIKQRKEKEKETEKTTATISTIVLDTEATVDTRSPTVSTATTFEVTPFVLDTTFATLSTSPDEISAAAIETTPFYTVEEITASAAEETEEMHDEDYETEATDEWLDADLYDNGLTPAETSTPYAVEEISTTSYELFLTPLTMATTSATDATLIADTEAEYDEEIESLKKQLREKERDLQEREKMLLEREQRLKEDMEKFESYMAEMRSEEIDTSTVTSEESTATSEELTAPTNLSTPVPPTEKPTIAKTVVTSRWETTKKIGVEEKKRTKYVPGEATTPKEEEEEVATKRICLNVLANTTIPYEKRSLDVVTEKICLPYFPGRKKAKKSIGRLSRKILSLRVMREIEKPRLNVLPIFRRAKRRRTTETSRKISNLQLSHREWLSNETTKSLRHFEGFTRMYKGTKRIYPENTKETVTDARENGDDPRATTSPYEQHVLDQQESPFQPITTVMSGGKKHRKRNAFPGSNSIRKRRSDLFDNNDEVTTIGYTTTTVEKKESDEDKIEFYTVNVLRFKYNEDEETHQTIPMQTDEDEATTFTPESNNEREYEDDGDDDFDDFEEDGKIGRPYHELEETDDAEEKDNESSKELEKKNEREETKEEEEDDYDRAKTSTLANDVKILVDPSGRGILVGQQKELMDQAWPTEKSTTYHLGGTRYWELETQITESPDTLSSTTDTTAETVDLSITRTTCLYVVVKNEKKHARTKHNARCREGNLRFPATSVAQRDDFLKNVTGQRILRSQKPKTKRSVGKNRISKIDEFSNTGDELSAMARGRKLCGINENEKLKRAAAKHKDSRNIKHNDENAKPTRSQKSRNVDSRAPRFRESDSCVVNKKNADQRKKITAKATLDHHIRVKSGNSRKNDRKLVRRDVTVARHKNKSAPPARKTHDCVSCICDIVDVINRVKSILDRLIYPLDEIKTLNCSRYKETRDKIVISMDSDAEEDARAFPQPRYNTESLKGQKYIKPKELEGDPRSDLVLKNDRDIISLPGLNLNVPCNRDGDGITWLSSVNRPSYTWKRTDGIALYGFVAENGDLELRNVNAKDTGNYTCVVTYMSADNEEPVEATYEIRLRIVTLPKYILHGESRYRVRFCDERGLDALSTYFPLKLNNVLCEADICNAYVLTPSCSRSQITMNVLLVPSHIVKLTAIDHKHCNIFCLKAIQDKLSLILSKNLQNFLEKTIIFRLPHFEQRLVPIVEKPSLARRRRRRSGTSDDGFGNDIGLFSSCPAGYGLRGTHCVPCDVDTYSEDGMSRCKKCPPGTYQPNHGARVCRTCTSPLTRGCYNMLWNSFHSAVMVTLASFSVMLSVFLLLVWVTCCAKKKFCAKQIISIVSDKDASQRERHVEERPLIKDVSENEDQQWDDEYKAKRKRGKFNVNRKRRTQRERRHEKKRIHEDGWGSHCIMNASMNHLDSYRSHEDYNNHYPRQSHRKGPPLPERDFDTS